MKQKGLGAGLGALFGDAALYDETPASAPAEFEYIQLQRIEPRQEQPRTVFEQEAIDDLAESIREHGLLSPILVRSLDSGYYQIIAGERRWRAARAAGLTEVPVRVVSADDKNALEIALVENLQREDLSPIEEARGYKSLMEEFSLTQEDVAIRVSKSRPAVANALRLLSLPPELIELVSRGELSAGSARAILVLKGSEIMLQTAKLAIENDMSVREVEKLVKKQAHARHRGKEKPEVKQNGMEVDYLLEAQNRLTTALGRRVSIKHSRSKGTVEIDYYGQDDFNELFDILISSNGKALGNNTFIEQE